MINCVNCGRKIKENPEVQLCKKCYQCETIYDAQKVKILHDLQESVKPAIFIVALATMLFVFTDFKHSNIAGMLLYAYAAISVGFTGADCFARFVQLRSKVREEQEEMRKIER